MWAVGGARCEAGGGRRVVCGGKPGGGRCALTVPIRAPPRALGFTLWPATSHEGVTCAAFLVFWWGGDILGTDVVNVPGCFVLLTGCWHHASPPPHSPPFPFRPL